MGLTSCHQSLKSQRVFFSWLLARQSEILSGKGLPQEDSAAVMEGHMGGAGVAGGQPAGQGLRLCSHGN